MIEGWTETCRSVVSPWECDVTEHFTIAYYFDRLADAAATIEDGLGLGEAARSARRSFDVRFVRELRAGASFHIVSAPIGVDEGSVCLGHQILDSANGEVTAWVRQALGEPSARLRPDVLDVVKGRLARWEGPEFEHRPEPKTAEGFIPTVRERVKPTDLDARGEFSLAAFVHRFTAAIMQALAAIGATASYMQSERRVYSTFELALRVTASPRLGDPILVETGILHLGNSSIRFMHRMCDPATGAEFARLGQFGVQLDLDARRPVALPAGVRSAAARHLVRTV
ncbi:MAG: thioesterase family protein [Stellaceae bacterium]